MFLYVWFMVKLYAFLALFDCFLFKHIPMYILLNKLLTPCSPREATHKKGMQKKRKFQSFCVLGYFLRQWLKSFHRNKLLLVRMVRGTHQVF